jgi:hypothetical protein
MKFVCAVIVAMAPLVAADKPAEKPAAKPAARSQAAASAKAAPKTQEIPVGAVKAAEGTWRYTDPAGKKWAYKKTPWGVVRMEDDGQAAAAAAAVSAEPGPAASSADRSDAKVKAIEQGDTVRFERPGPFGVYRWERKKTELSQAERGWLEASRNGSQATATQE